MRNSAHHGHVPACNLIAPQMLAFLIQLGTIPFITDPEVLNLKRTVLTATAFMLVLGIVPDLSWLSIRIIGLGFVLNTLVISANGGLMPIAAEDLRLVTEENRRTVQLGQTPPGSKNVMMLEADTRLGFLADRIYVSFPSAKIYSIGDLVLAAGLALFLAEVAARAFKSRGRLRMTPDAGEG